jgi:hypothetical protein
VQPVVNGRTISAKQSISTVPALAMLPLLFELDGGAVTADAGDVIKWFAISPAVVSAEAHAGCEETKVPMMCCNCGRAAVAMVPSNGSRDGIHFFICVFLFVFPVPLFQGRNVVWVVDVDQAGKTFSAWLAKFHSGKSHPDVIGVAAQIAGLGQYLSLFAERVRREQRERVLAGAKQVVDVDFLIAEGPVA